MSKVTHILLQIARWIGIVLLSILALLLIIILLIRLPWVQQKITNYATNYVSDKVDTKVDIDKLFITFTGNLQLEGLYVEGQKRDTLVYSESLEAGVGIMPLINGNIHVSKVDWNGLKANIVRRNDSSFNFSFIMDALAGSGDTTAANQGTSPSDTASSPPPEISLGPINLENFDISYLDSLSGIDAILKLGKLVFTTEELKLKEMIYRLDELELQNTTARVVQFAKPPPPPEEDTTTSSLPLVAWNQLLLENIELHYRTEPDTLDADMIIGEFFVADARLALEQQEIAADVVRWNNSDINLKLPVAPAQDTAVATTDTLADTAGFSWPQWQLELEKLAFENNNIRIDRGPAPAPKNTFDPNHFGLQNLAVQLQNVQLQQQQASLEVEEISFTERSGFQLQHFDGSLQVSDENLDINSLDIQTGHSELHTSLQMDYQSIDSLMANPVEGTNIALNVGGQTRFGLEDAYYFNDSLRHDSLWMQLDNYPIELQADISGKLSNIKIDNLQVSALQNTSFSMQGRIENITDTNAIEVRIPEIRLSTVDQDLAVFMDTAGADIPSSLVVEASLRGSPQSLQAELDLQTPQGYLDFDGQASDLLGVPSYQGNLQTNNLAVGAFTGTPELGPVSFTMQFDGCGTKPKNLYLDTDIGFQKLIYNNYSYADLKLKAQVEQGMANLQMSHRDSNLSFELKAEAELETQEVLAELKLNLDGADLQDLNLAQRPIKVATELKAEFEGSPQDFKAQLKVDQGIFISEKTTYRLDSLYASLKNTTSEMQLLLASPFIEGQLQAKTSVQKLASNLQTYIQQAIGGADPMADTIFEHPVDMQGGFVIRSSPLISQIILPGLERMDSVSISTTFRPKQDTLRLDINSPTLIYNGIELQNLSFDLDATDDSTNLVLNFDQLQRDPINMYDTELELHLVEGDGMASMEVLNSEGKEVFFTSVDVQHEKDFTRISVDTNKLVLNSSNWNIAPGNYIRFGGEQTNFHQFRLSRNEQMFEIESFEQKGEMLIQFDQFKLAAIFSILNADEIPVNGRLNGSVRLVDLKQTPAFVADVQLRDFGVMGTPLGTAKLEANSMGGSQYELTFNIEGQQLFLQVDGLLNNAGDQQNLDLTAELDSISMKLIEALVPETLDSTQGYISGNFSINGPTSDLNYDGQLSFTNVQMVPTMLGTIYKLGDERISIDDESVGFDDFTLVGTSGNTTVIDGSIGIENLANPSFDLNIDADKFTFLDVTKEENAAYYGKAVVSMELDISGDQQLPVIDAQINVLDETNVYYVVPTSQAQMVSRQGVVQFRNMKDSIDVLSAEDDKAPNLVQGIDLDAVIDLASNVRATIIIDPQSGDNLTIAGQADLNFNLKPNGNMSLTGSYEIDDGSYQLNLFELVKKKFDLRDGSRIVWYGEPTQASLDLTAVYTTETAPASLMADPANQYKQSVPFQVLLYIEGTIEEPEISFGLSMPEDVRGEFGGTVYQRIQQLNQNEAELNKQVFSLIVFNRFLPTGSVGDEGGGTSALARSSVANLLTGQLNKLADKYVAGVELNIDVDSYTDYRSGDAQRRTDLNVSLQKAFFDERVIVQVGTEVGLEGQRENTAAIGNVSVEYLIDEDGNYRARAFRKDQYLNIVEGQVIITGLGLLFNKDFNTWEELWQDENPPPPENQEDNSQNDKGRNEENQE